MRASHVFFCLAVVYIIANVAAYIQSNIFTVGQVFNVFGVYLPPLLIVPALIEWQIAGRPKPVAMGIFLVVIFLVAAVNIFLIWLNQSYAK